MIGITRTGVAIYNPLTGDLLNAVEGSNQETFDSCDGHSSPNGAYHYHKIPDSCLYKGEEDEFIGVALDGYPIYGPNVSDSDHILTSADLDECHGRVINGTYRYHATSTWPYFMGCFKGVVMQDLINLAYTCNLTEDSGTSLVLLSDAMDVNGHEIILSNIIIKSLRHKLKQKKKRIFCRSTFRSCTRFSTMSIIKTLSKMLVKQSPVCIKRYSLLCFTFHSHSRVYKSIIQTLKCL